MNMLQKSREKLEGEKEQLKVDKNALMVDKNALMVDKAKLQKRLNDLMDGTEATSKSDAEFQILDLLAKKDDAIAKKDDAIAKKDDAIAMKDEAIANATAMHIDVLKLIENPPTGEVLAQALQSLRFESSALETPANQAPASSYSSKNAHPLAFGYLPTWVTFDPSYFRETQTLHELLVPSASDIVNAPLLNIHIEQAGLVTSNEIVPGGVTEKSNNFLPQYRFVDNGRQSLQTRGLSLGIASPASFEDAHIRLKGFYLAVLEHKGSEGSILAALKQAAITATNFAMRLLSLGLAREHCIVPVIGNTGLAMMFGAIVVLNKSFPTFVPLSKLLDLQHSTERQIASAHLFKARTHCEAMVKLIPAASKCPLVTSMLLDTTAYFIKRIDNDVFERGFGLFTDSGGDHMDIDSGVNHMMEVYNCIYASEEARDVVEYPLSIRTPGGGCSDYQIIYRDLRSMGYTCGAPNRIVEPAVFDVYRRRVIEAVGKLHAAGVIHGDLYLSNIMYKVSLDCADVSVKIIDLDCAHCLVEGAFTPKIQALYEEYLGPNNTQFGINHDRLYLQVLHLAVEDGEGHVWEGLASGNKSTVDSCYRLLFSKIIQ